MTSLSLAAILQAAVLSTGATTYAEAHQQNAETGRPLVVLIGADWCPHCVVMKRSTVPQLASRGWMQRVAFAEVNSDREGALAQQLMQGGPIPQLIMFHRTADGWQRNTLVGSRSISEIESFLQQGLKAPLVAVGSSD